MASIAIDSSEGPIHLSDKLNSAMATISHSQWSPYEDNGGTTLAIAGPDFCVLAADTRLSRGYSILSRDVSHARQITDHCSITSGGCFTDCHVFQKNLAVKAKNYKFESKKEMSTEAIAQLASTMLYYRRMFPYYAFNIVGGVTSEGKGVCYSYDAVGSFEPARYACNGSGTKFIIPVLDNIIGMETRRDKPEEPYTIDEVVEIVKSVFIAAGERNIYVGDAVEIFKIEGTGTTKEVFELKKD